MGDVLSFHARSVMPVGRIANSLRRVAGNFRGVHYNSGAGEALAAHMTVARPMTAKLRKENPGIHLEFDPSSQQLSLGLPEKSGQQIAVLANGNDRYQAALTEGFESEAYPHLELTRERRVILKGDGQRVIASSTGLDEFFLRVTATDGLMRGLFEAMGKVSEHTLASRAFATAQFLLTLYAAPESTGVVLLAEEKKDDKYIVLKPELLADRNQALRQIAQTIGSKTDGFDLIFAATPKAPAMARIIFTGIKDHRDPELVIWLSEDPALREPALLREGLLQLFAKTEDFIKQQDAQADSRIPSRLP